MPFKPLEQQLAKVSVFQYKPFARLSDCPKCAAGDFPFTPKYVATSSNPIYIKPAHLAWTCRHCGYLYDTLCADASTSLDTKPSSG